MDSLTKASLDVMIKEDEGISAKMRQLLNAGLIKEKKDLPFFKSAMKKVKGGTITTVQERQVLLNVLGQFLTMVDEAPEFFNLMRRELAKGKMKKEEIEKVSEDFFNKNIKKDEGHLADNKQPGEKMKKIGEEKKIEEDDNKYGFTSFKNFRNKNESWEEDRAMAAQKAQMPASLGGTHKDRSANKASTQVTKKKSQYARPQAANGSIRSEDVETTDEATLGQSGNKAARMFRQGQKQNDPIRQRKASELRTKAGEARSQRRYDKMGPEGKKREDDWARDRHDHAMNAHT